MRTEDRNHMVIIDSYVGRKLGAKLGVDMSRWRLTGFMETPRD